MRARGNEGQCGEWIKAMKIGVETYHITCAFLGQSLPLDYTKDLKNAMENQGCRCSISY